MSPTHLLVLTVHKPKVGSAKQGKKLTTGIRPHLFFMVGLKGSKGLFQLKWFHDSVIHRPLACNMKWHQLPGAQDRGAPRGAPFALGGVFRWSKDIQIRLLTLLIFTQMRSGRDCLLLWAGQGLSATHRLWKNSCVLQWLPRRLGGWPGIKGISCRNPGASLHLKPQEDSGKKSWCCCQS